MSPESLTALGVSGALAALAYRTRSLTLAGALTGCLLGTVVLLCLDWRGFLLKGLFLLLGSGATRLGVARKRQLGVAQLRGGRRSAAQVRANGGVAGACALLSVFAAGWEAFLWPFIASLAPADHRLAGGRARNRRGGLCAGNRQRPAGGAGGDLGCLPDRAALPGPC